MFLGDDPECQIIEQKPDLSQSHALLSRDTTLEYLNLVANEKKKPEVGPPKNNTNTVINKIYSSVKSKVNNCRPEGFGESYDIRLESFLHYCVANELTVDHYKKAVLEQVALQAEIKTGSFLRIYFRGGLLCVSKSVYLYKSPYSLKEFSFAYTLYIEK